MNRKDEIKILKNICSPVVDYLKENYDPYCTVIITDYQIKLVRDEIGIPIEGETTPGVEVQEQFIPEDSNGVKFCESKCVFPS
ncbi:MAG: hypothetical protein RR782_06800 [Clostridium sp.]